MSRSLPLRDIDGTNCSDVSRQAHFRGEGQPHFTLPCLNTKVNPHISSNTRRTKHLNHLYCRARYAGARCPRIWAVILTGTSWTIHTDWPRCTSIIFCFRSPLIWLSLHKMPVPEHVQHDFGTGSDAERSGNACPDGGHQVFSDRSQEPAETPLLMAEKAANIRLLQASPKLLDGQSSKTLANTS